MTEVENGLASPGPDNMVEVEEDLANLNLGPEVTKEAIRNQVWQYLEKNNIAKFPRPVTKRIPNFEGAVQACDQLTDLEEFKHAQTIKVNPDKPQEQARFLVLEGGKTLVVTPLRRSARTNVLHKMVPPQDASDKDLRVCSRYQGVKEHSAPVGFESKVSVDLVIIGCVAASKDGWRIGKGEGFADLEFAMMASMGAVNDDTVVVATCHDCQVLDLPDHLFGAHDLTVDFILTPTQIIKCDKKPKPKGIIWSLLSEEKLERIPILKKLRFLERQEGRSTLLEGQTEDMEAPGADDAYVEPVYPEEDDEEDDRRRNNRRRYNRNRPNRGRGRRSEEEGEDGGEGGEEGSGERRPAPRSQRSNPRNPRGGGQRNRRRSDNQQQDGDSETALDGQDPEARPPRRQRPPRNRQNSGRRSRRRSQGSESRGEEDDDADNNKENKPRRRTSYRRRSQRGGSRSEDGGGDEEKPRKAPRARRNTGSGGNGPLPAVYVGNLPRGLRVSEFKGKFREQNVNPLRVTWRGQVGYSYLVFESMEEVEAAMKVLSGMSIHDRQLRVELANRTQQQRGGGGGGSDQAAGDHDSA